MRGHPVRLLHQYKREHEERIDRVTGIDCRRKTYIVTYAANIGLRKGVISPEQMRTAILSENRYPATNASIDLDMTQNAATDVDQSFWETECQNIDGFVEGRIRGLGPDGNQMEHLSLFALAPIPLLMYLGKALGDIGSMDVYQRHRDTESWKWQSLPAGDFDYSVEVSEGNIEGASDVILELSLSDAIDQHTIRQAIPDEAPLCRISIETPNRDFLKAKAQLDLFADRYRCLLSKIRAVFGASCRIHLFPAVPVSIAIQIGRMVLPKSDAPLTVYDFNSEHGGWIQTLII